MPEQGQRQAEPAPWSPGGGPGAGGPRVPSIDKPDTRRLLEKMRRVDSDRSRKFRQRSGQ